MKKLIGIMFYFLILTGCADKAEEVAMIEEVSEPASEETMQPMLLEYMWCDFGSDTSEESMAALTADFNEIVSVHQSTKLQVLGAIYPHLKQTYTMQFG